MKLIAAKCPSCGASIQVDKDSDRTKCEYCRSQIIVDDAIQKYKIEISGKVKVDGILSIDEKINQAKQHYALEEYNDVQNILNDVISQDAFNIEAQALLLKTLVRRFEISTTPEEEDLFDLGDDFYTFNEEVRYSKNDDYDDKLTKWNDVDNIVEIYKRATKINKAKLDELLEDDLKQVKHFCEISEQLKKDETTIRNALKKFDGIRDDIRLTMYLESKSMDEKICDIVKKNMLVEDSFKYKIIDSGKEFFFTDLYSVQRDGSIIVHYMGKEARLFGKKWFSQRFETTQKPQALDEVLKRIENLTNDAQRLKDNPKKFKSNQKKGLFDGLLKKKK